MTVVRPLRRAMALVGLSSALLTAWAACSTNEPPEPSFPDGAVPEQVVVSQVFVAEMRVPPGADRLQFAYGDHPDIGGLDDREVVNAVNAPSLAEILIGRGSGSELINVLRRGRRCEGRRKRLSAVSPQQQVACRVRWRRTQTNFLQAARVS